MQVNIGLIDSDNIFVKTLNLETNLTGAKVIPISKLAEENFHLLFFDSNLNLEPIAQVIKQEEKIYPILDVSSVQLDKASFESLNFSDSIEIYNKIHNRWVLTKNMLLIENLYAHTSELKTLWLKDRNKFFEELWVLIKKNIGAIDLNIIFHDLKELTESQKEKGDKPILCNSVFKGTKSPVFSKGSDFEDQLMQDYAKDFNEIMNITEFDPETGKIVICANVEKSPIIIMAVSQNFNQLQRSIVQSIFNGLN